MRQPLVTRSAGSAYCDNCGGSIAYPVCPGEHTPRLGVLTAAILFVPFDEGLALLGLDDSRRPWVRQEKDRFKSLLESNGLAVQEHKYFDGVEPTLLMHFEVIQAMRRGQLTV